MEKRGDSTHFSKESRSLTANWENDVFHSNHDFLDRIGPVRFFEVPPEIENRQSFIYGQIQSDPLWVVNELTPLNYCVTGQITHAQNLIDFLESFDYPIPQLAFLKDQLRRVKRAMKTLEKK